MFGILMAGGLSVRTAKLSLIAIGIGLTMATAAHAEDEQASLLVYKTWPSEKELRAALPAGLPSTRVRMSCVAADDRFSECKVIEQTPAGPDTVGAASVNLIKTTRFAPNDDDGKPVAGRSFETTQELLAPGDKNSDWVRKPSVGNMLEALPAKAMKAGKGGSALLNCRVTIDGFLDRCRVEQETPQGYDFGAAALQLSTQFAMSPKIRGGQRVEGEVRIPIVFGPPGERVLDPGDSRVVVDPDWIKTPTAAAIKAAYPSRAADLATGQAAVRCKLNSKGETTDCMVTSEYPTGRNFGLAAKRLAGEFQLVVAPEQALAVRSNLMVDIPFRFRNPAMPDEAPLTSVRWTHMLAPRSAQLLFPPAAKAEGVLAGMGYVNCVATAEGRLADCRVTKEEPAAKGFGAAALEAAKAMRMNPWTKAGDAVEGRRLTLPIGLKYDATAPASAPKP